MTFLNKKEQVLDIELTQHGKRLLSHGKMKPVYYAFFDDDILYDSEYGGFEENRNDSGERIRNLTPALQVQYVFSGIETEVKKAVEQKRNSLKEGDNQGVSIVGTAEKHFANSAPLGNSSLNDSDAPAWRMNFLQGNISGSVQVVTGSQPNMKIPRITVDNVTYKTSPVKPSLDGPEARSGLPFGDFGNDGDGTVSDLNFASARFEDGSFIKIEDDFLLFELKEDNVDSLKKNFDIEIFIQEQDRETGRDIYTPLFFEQKSPLVENDILLDQESIVPTENKLLDPSYVEHFFHVYVDDEISKDVLCRLVPTPELEASFPGEFFDCVDRDAKTEVGGLYDSDVREEDLDPDC